MAMGDANAVSFGQAAHLGLMLDAGVADWESLLCLRGRIPRSPSLLGIVIDDLVLLEKVVRGIPANADNCSRPALVKRIRAAYERVGLPRHAGKGFALQSFGEFWGAQVFGDRGLVRPNWTRLIPLASLTARVSELPLVSISLLEVLAGSWVSALSFRRRSLCLLQEVYVMQRGRARRHLVWVTEALRLELFRLAVLAPLISTDARAQTSGLLVASDASDDMGAFVTSFVGTALARELQRHVPAKGLWTKLLGPADALIRARGYLPAEDELPGESYRTHPVWTEVARSQAFTLGAVFRRRRLDHINLKEAESYIAAEESLCTNVWESSRTVALLDSQVCVGAFMKGRSASFSLNSRLRASLPGLLFFNLHPHYAYVASEDNPADDPSRRVSLRKPCTPEPAWLCAAKAGRFELLDAYLKAQGLEPGQLAGLPELKASFDRQSKASGFPCPEVSSEPSCLSPCGRPSFVNSGVLGTVPSASHEKSKSSFLKNCSDRQFLWPAGVRPSSGFRSSEPGYLCLYAGKRVGPDV